MEWLHIPLVLSVVLITLPVTLPVAMIQDGMVQRRKRRRAVGTLCARCGTVLGEAARARADAVWSEHVAKLHREQPHVMFRLVRKVWAVCVACGQEYDYDEKADAFVVPKR